MVTGAKDINCYKLNESHAVNCWNADHRCIAYYFTTAD
jgi:hypothetical protein